MSKKLMFCFGTRPEAIKMAPVVKEAKGRGHEVRVCLSGQHRDMIIPFLEFFEIESDYDLDIMKPNQSLGRMTAAILEGMNEVFASWKPDCLFVQGDTTTTFTSALSAFYQHIPVAHIEAGLRTGDVRSPFPEELNRRLTSPIAALHFPPTKESQENLLKEGYKNNNTVTGNTSVDALRLAIEKIRSSSIQTQMIEKYPFISEDDKTLLVTAHRRENHGEPLKRICQALKKLAENKELQLVIPVHLNPNVREMINDYLSELENVHLLEPLDYIDFMWFMDRSFLIVTDSGGVQEEAPYLKKPILVLRDNTERPEGVAAGASKLVGSDFDKIINEVSRLLEDSSYYESFQKNENPYGDGFASQKILDEVEKFLS